MTNVCKSMLRDKDHDSPAKCRERRRRRIEMRRLASIPASGTPPPSSENHVESSSSSSTSSCVANGKRIRTSEMVDLGGLNSSVSHGDEVEEQAVETPSGPPMDCPAFGTMAVAGRSREMEDAIAVYTSLCKPAINRRGPVHFFAVFDGHGGPHVAALCKERMHVFLEGELMRVDHHSGSGENRDGSSGNSRELDFQRDQDEGEKGWEEMWRRVLKRSFHKMDEAALNTCACGCVGFECGCHPMEVALGGSTAVVAVLTPEHIIVANCGDSRAVLCRGGRAISLSFDHKPDRSDELARIKAAGGRVIFLNGARVEGILAMSRAIGLNNVCKACALLQSLREPYGFGYEMACAVFSN
ncbi:probable protein phosphatase 2C 75 isoform X2 [Jatropha curcas]|uniref:probable protein phosphatase 2C 75 isoform X2 n=1 Tax=Jatropha curcas TaxID=180498 RepID=UPI0005FAF90A|nr:probable protein phosphatase 2C 75 isoform X2 [Jatropha curcas]